ncbi:MAG: tetratricopeptide repeat protein, partial [Candidatus Poribacteria bacterium]|nr:tetratricopeptide repeat protein [Candidatus Poribacteria bacterium]
MPPIPIIQNIMLLIFAQPALSVSSSEPKRLQNACAEHLKTIGKAIAAYRADHRGDMPNWLSDLYPEYLSDPQMLCCPADKEGGNPVFKALTDPKMPCSYLYEFSPIIYSFSTWVFDRHLQEKYTYNELRTKQLRYFGGLIPVVRCWHHKQGSIYGSSLDLRYDGKVDILSDLWERSPEGVQAVFSFFERAIEENPERWEGQFSLQKIASYFRACKRFVELQALLEKASNLSTDAQKILVEIYESEGKIHQAIERCESLSPQVPDDIEMRVTLARLYAEAKNYDAARSEIDQVLRRDPQNSEAYRLYFEFLAIDHADRLQTELVRATEASDAIPLQARYWVKLQERLFRSEKTLLPTIRAAREDLQGSIENEESVIQLRHLYETMEKSLARDTGRWKTYTTADGLTSDFVHAIAQDRRGVLWIGTSNGVCLYNGENFTPFAPSQAIRQAEIWSICIEDGGQIWFGTRKHG